MLRKEGSNEFYLDLNYLEAGQEYSKVCYLSDIDTGISKTSEGFYRFFIKDVNAKVVIGRLFNVEHFIEQGLTALALKRKPVKIHFLVQEFNGSHTLIIRTIKLYTGEFDYKLFVGNVQDSEEYLEYVSSVLGKSLSKEIKLPAKYSIESLSKVFEGRCGGYTKLLEMVCQSLISYKELPSIEFRDLMYVFYVVQHEYFKYLKRLEVLDVITKSERLKNLLTATQKYEGTNQAEIILDTLTALYDLGKAEHLYAVLIQKSFLQNIEILNLATTYNSMIVGAKKEMGDISLVKY